jgi:NAD(P)-dependent dehydrogenase (short-subunit alcohol dehydrogenase family)
MAFGGSVALVTGAASGMGRLSAQRLAGAGARVAAVDVTEDALAGLAEQHEGIRAFPCDVSDTRAVEELVARVESELGPLDRVMSAAAIAPSGLLVEQDPELVVRMMSINYGGVVNVAYAVLPRMLRRRRGELVHFGSLAGWLPSIHTGAYSASKFAVNSFSEVLWHENRNSGVKILCVCPPVVETPMLGQMVGRAQDMLRDAPRIQPDEVLDAIEAGLEQGRLWVFPGRGSAAAWRIRRWLPGLLWKRIHSAAGI